MVECWLPYGDTEVHMTVDIKDLLSIAEPIRQDSQRSMKEIIATALAEPRGTKKLEELVGPDCTVAITVEGTTSPESAVAVLSPIITQLVNLVVPKDRISILVANGIREKSGKDIIKALKADEELKGVAIIEHTRATTYLSNLGETRQRTPLMINKVYSEANLKIAIGEVCVDPYTGFSGAHTAILPGISSYTTVEAHRKLILKGDIKPGVVELNQVKEDALEAARLAGCDIAIQLVDNQHGRLLSAYVGALEETWGQAIYALGSGLQVNAEAGADVVVVSAGGSKHDYNLYTATWALQGASRLVKKGGVIVLLAECPEGLGVDAYTSLAHIEQMAELERRYALGAEALQILKTVLVKVQVFLVSSLPRYMVEPLGFSVAKTANDAYEKAIEGRRGRRTLVIPYGCTTIPVGD